MTNNEIETTNYSIGNKYFVIYPTQNDLIKFGTMLKKDSGVNSMSEFKKTSKIYKEVFAELDKQSLKVLRKPYVPFDTNIRLYGKTSSRLFDCEGVLYCSIDGKEQEQFGDCDI